MNVMKNVIVVGGGAAGMMAAIAAAENGAKVKLFEKNEKLGKKIYITGKGRCNVTNNCEAEDFFANVVTNSKFMYSSYYGFDNNRVYELIEENGCRLKTERGNRVFPVSDHSSDIISCLNRLMKNNKVEVFLNSEVSGLIIKEQKCRGAILKNNKEVEADSVIVATGGLSYQSTGSTGDGMKWAKESEHRIVDCSPALVPFVIKEEWVKSLQGLSLKNVSLEMTCGKKKLYSGFGEMMFTHFGVTGPLILSASSYYSKFMRNSKNSDSDVIITLDLKSALSAEQLDKRLIRDFERDNNKKFRNGLGDLLPSKMIPIIIELSGIDPDKAINLVTKEERNSIVSLLKNMSLTVVGTRGYNEAIITQGGISVKDINPSTMESKIVNDLYFCGEVLDLDALTGGFNLQIAWSTGHLAGESSAINIER